MRGLLVLLLFCGCDDGGSTPSPPVEAGILPDAAEPVDAQLPPLDVGAEMANIEIGTGARRFAELTPGQEIPIIEGIQGGFHVWGGFRGVGFDDTDVRILFELEWDGTVIGRADYTELELPVDDQGRYSYAAVAVVYDENSMVERTSGSPMILRAEVRTLDGGSHTDSIPITPVCCD